MSASRKSVLIVDDERTLLYTFSNSLKSYASDLDILTAEDGRQAVDILNSGRVDMVVTDLKMPEMDGFQLLIHMKKHYPGIPVIVMTAVGCPEVADRLKALGTVSYLEKPINIKDLALKIFQGIAAASQGKISGITLSGFLQLVVMEGKTCALKISSGDKTGVLLIKDGELIDAKTRDLSGEAAACDIVTWDDTEIKMGNYTGERRRNIDTALSEILLEAFRIRDERERTARGREESADDFTRVDGMQRKQEDIPDTSEDGPPPDAGAGGSAPDAGSADRGATVLPLNEEKATATLRDLLSELSKLQGVSAVCLAGCDGFVIDNVSNAKTEAELVGAIASSGFGASESIGRELGRGALELTMLEFEQGAVVIAPVGKNLLLVIMADRDANLGMLRIKIRKLEKEIETAANAV